MIPTPDQIHAEIERLMECAKKIRQFNAAGDDNHQAIGGQIETLRQNVQPAAIEAVMDSLPFYTTDAMVRAREWLDGEYTMAGEPENYEDAYAEALSSEWAEITTPEE